jgi:hypothetical protein
MKKVIIIMIVAVLLVGCAPTDQAVQTAIARIKMAATTLSFSLMNTTVPNQTVKQLPPLRYCLLYPFEISSISDRYSTKPEIDRGILITDSIDQIRSAYISDDGDDANIYFWIVQFSDEVTASDNFNYIIENLYSSTSYVIPESIDLPSDTVAYLQAEGSIILAYRIHDMVVLTGMMRLPYINEYDQIKILAINGEKQKYRLQECGYLPQDRLLIFQFTH